MAGLIPEETLNEIRERVRLEQVVSSYVTLKPSGRSLKGLCPFHSEKTPSFNVSPDKQYFHCFGCGVGGDMFKFIEMIEGVDFAEAARILAARAGVRIELVDETESSRQRRQLREALHEMHDLAAKFYHHILTQTRHGREALAYLHGRGVEDGAIERFELGYSLAAWDHLGKFLKKRGFRDDEIEQSGLVVVRNGKEAYDRFRARVTYPIRDVNGKVVGFGGRTLGADQPKYLNSPETVLFSKSRLLYGLDLAKEQMRRSSQAVIVEGYMDVIACHQAGITNVVASLGTAMTQHHARLLSRYASEVVILYDGDLAGQSATARGLDILAGEGIKVRVASLPEGEDPDTFIQSRGSDALQDALSSAVGLMDYRINLALSGSDLSDPSGKAEASRACIAVLAGIDEAIERNERSKNVAFRLGVDEELFASEVESARRKGRRQTDINGNYRHTNVVNTDSSSASTDRGPMQLEGQSSVAADDKSILADKLCRAETLLLQLCLAEPALARLVKEKIRTDSLADPALYDLIVRLAELPDGADVARFHSELVDGIDRPDLKRLLHGLLVVDHGVSDKVRAVRDCVARIEERRIQRAIVDLQRKLRDAERSADLEESQRLTKEIMAYQRLRKEIVEYLSNLQ